MPKWLRPSSLRSSIGNDLANEPVTKSSLPLGSNQALLSHISRACSYFGRFGSIDSRMEVSTIRVSGLG
jgi:hypothetical protein